jgi:hypothetical protein
LIVWSRATISRGNVLEVRKGDNASELVWVTVEGEVPCRVTEDDMFAFFEMHSGENDFCALKGDFLEELSGDQLAVGESHV